uniref:DUF148 domain-containing protein n=1 Tax=Parastrongyloides trichosuri TaxID=131310 RepID=A0A0N4ZMZ2_PARTI
MKRIIILLFFVIITQKHSSSLANETLQNSNNDISNLEKTIKVINETSLDSKFNDSRNKLITILQTNDIPTTKINLINKMMNQTNYSEEEQIQFYKTLTDAVMSSKGN